jgi:hypothetical protein
VPRGQVSVVKRPCRCSSSRCVGEAEKDQKLGPAAARMWRLRWQWRCWFTTTTSCPTFSPFFARVRSGSITLGRSAIFEGCAGCACEGSGAKEESKGEQHYGRCLQVRLKKMKLTHLTSAHTSITTPPSPTHAHTCCTHTQSTNLFGGGTSGVAQT